MATKLSSLLPWGLAAGAAALLTVVWITSSSDEHFHDDHDHDHDNEHEEFISLTSDQIAAIGIEISTAGPGILQEHFEAPATITLNCDRLAHIYPKVAGIVKEAKRNLGENVRAMELLALLESKEAADLKTAYLAALKKHNVSKVLLDQEQELRDKGLGVLQDFQNSVQASNKSELTLETSRQNLFALGMTLREIEQLPITDPATLRFYELRSPIAGSIIERQITLGQQLSPTDDAYIIADLSDLWVEISLYPSQVANLQQGQNVNLRDSKGRKGSAELLYIGAAMDNETRRIKAIALLDNSLKEWQPGNYVTATIDSASTPINLAIHQNGVQKLDGQTCAFIANDNGFEIRPVQLGRTDGQFVEVISGINDGERYASSHSFLLKAEHEKDDAEHMH
jgi:cobalt-zinc-cadmium efflux system membrane fusion protein